MFLETELYETLGVLFHQLQCLALLPKPCLRRANQELPTSIALENVRSACNSFFNVGHIPSAGMLLQELEELDGHGELASIRAYMPALHWHDWLQHVATQSPSFIQCSLAASY